MISGIEYRLLKKIELLISNGEVVIHYTKELGSIGFHNEVIDFFHNRFKKDDSFDYNEVFILDTVVREEKKLIIKKFTTKDSVIFSIKDSAHAEMEEYTDHLARNIELSRNEKRQTFALWITTLALVTSIVFNILNLLN